jgi:glycosyltransferase 2 family protein
VLWPEFGIILAGSFGVIALLAVLGLLVPRLLAVRQMAVAGLATLGVCLALDALLGPAGGRPPIPALHGIDASYPVTQLAVALAVALTGLPFLSRPMHRIVGTAIALAALAALVGGYGLPLNVASAIALGWGMAAACHLAFGSPAGLPSAAEVTDAVRDLRVDVHALAPMADQPWGVEAFAGQDEQGRPLELAVYGRDAADAQWLNKVWRFCVYRDSGPTLMIHRLQQVEHEAYLTLLAAKAGVLVPEVVAAGQCGPRGDAVLATRLPAGPTCPPTRSATSSSPRSSPRCWRCARRASRTARSARRPSSSPRAARACVTSAAPRPPRRPGAPTGTWPRRWPPPRCWPAPPG